MTTQPQTQVRGYWGASRLYAIGLIVFGAIGVYMSVLIMYDKIKLMEDTSFVPACTFNSVFSCTDVMQSEQALAFVIPNPFIGMVGFGVVLAIGAAILAGAKFRSWFWYGFLAGLIFAAGFVHWMAYQAVYEIQALCLYCMVVWAATLPLFLMTLMHIVWERQRDEAEVGQPDGSDRYSFTGGWIMPIAVLVVWYLAFIVLIVMQFA